MNRLRNLGFQESIETQKMKSNQKSDHEGYSLIQVIGISSRVHLFEILTFRMLNRDSWVKVTPPVADFGEVDSNTVNELKLTVQNIRPEAIKAGHALYILV